MMRYAISTLLLDGILAWMVKLPATRALIHKVALFSGVSKMLLVGVAAGVLSITVVLPAGSVT